MKSQFFLRICFVLCLFGIFGCSQDDDGNPQDSIPNRQSVACNNVVGWTGAYWDFANALPVPLNGPLFIPNPGQQFIHSQLPLLGFIIPDNYSAFEITNPQISAIGVDVVRNDNGAILRWLPNSFVLQTIPSQSVIANEINGLFSFYGFNGTPEVLCSEFKQEVFAGIPKEFNARLLRFGDRIAQVWVITTYVAGGTAIAISVATAPENEYETEIVNTFWPINFQLFVDDNGNIIDQDGDGFTVLEDRDDTDPNVPVNQNN